MTKLPFVVEPRTKSAIDRIGNEDIGILEIERKGYLSVQERNFVQQIQGSDQGSMIIVKLSKKVGKRHGLDLEAAYNLVISCINPDEATDHSPELRAQVEEEFAEDISTMISGLASMQSKSELVEALCILVHRVNANLTPNDLQEIHPDLIVELSKFYKEEYIKSTERLKELNSSEESEGNDSSESVKKPRKTTTG